LYVNLNTQKDVVWSTKIEYFGNYRYIEIIKGFKIYEIIAYTKLIHAHYRIFWLDVKPKALIMQLQSNKKGESTC